MSQDNNNHSESSMFSDYPEVLDIKDMRRALGIGRSMAYRLIKNGKIKYLRFGKIIKIPRQYLVDYILSECHTEKEAEH